MSALNALSGFNWAQLTQLAGNYTSGANGTGAAGAVTTPMHHHHHHSEGGGEHGGGSRSQFGGITAVFTSLLQTLVQFLSAAQPGSTTSTTGAASGTGSTSTGTSSGTSTTSGTGTTTTTTSAPAVTASAPPATTVTSTAPATTTATATTPPATTPGQLMHDLGRFLQALFSVLQQLGASGNGSGTGDDGDDDHRNSTSSYGGGLASMLQALVQQLSAATQPAPATGTTPATTTPVATDPSATSTSATSASTPTAEVSDHAMRHLQHAFMRLLRDLTGGAGSVASTTGTTSTTGTAASSGTTTASGGSSPTLLSFLQAWLSNLQNDLGGSNTTTGTLVNTTA